MRRELEVYPEIFSCDRKEGVEIYKVYVVEEKAEAAMKIFRWCQGGRSINNNNNNNSCDNHDKCE